MFYEVTSDFIEFHRTILAPGNNRRFQETIQGVLGNSRKSMGASKVSRELR